MTRALRHNPAELGLRLDARGASNIDEMLQSPALRSMKANRVEVFRAVEAQTKQRLSIEGVGPGAKIRALNGHSRHINLDDDLVHSEVFRNEAPTWLVHFTHTTKISSIVRDGLSARSRRDIHMYGVTSTGQALPRPRSGTNAAIWMRSTDLLDTGARLRRSHNGMFLTQGIRGRVSASVFSFVENTRTGHEIPISEEFLDLPNSSSCTVSPEWEALD